MNPFSLDGKTIFVTGASSGIGRSISVICSQMGAQLIITGRNSERLNETYTLLQGDNHVQLQADLNNIIEIGKLISALPKIDGFVCNAGIARPVVLQQAEESDVNDLVSINALAPINLTRLLIQDKKLNKNASIVFMSSINGNQCSSIGNSVYAATKSALTGFMKGVALELSHRKIRVNCINPGMIETDIFTGSAIGTDELEADKRKYPLGRYGKPEEVAYAAVYLLSDAAQWVTGTSLLIDGGFTLQ